MKPKHTILIFFILIGTNCFSLEKQSPNPPTSPQLFYKDLISSIDYIQGNMIMNISDGLWKQKVDGVDVIWRNDNNTLVTFQFNYKSGNLQKDSYLAFSPAIHVWVRNGTSPGLSLVIDTIRYNQIGQFKSWGSGTNYDNLKKGLKQSPINPGKSSIIQDALAINLRVDDFFKGNLFANYNNPQSVNEQLGNLPNSSPFIKQIFFLSDGNNPGLSIGLKRGSTLHFSKKASVNLFDNSITLSSTSPSSATFDYIKYDFETNEMHGQLSNFQTSIQDGNITTGSDMFLHLLPASTLAFNSLRFDYSNLVTSIDCSSGSLTAAIGAGSRINFTKNVKNPSYVVFADNSNLNLNGFSFNIQDKKFTDINISGGSNLSVSVRDAQIGIGEQSFISFGSGQITANLQGDYNSSADAPNSTVKITDLNCAISGGKLLLNSNTNLIINGGSLKSTDLLLQGHSSSGFTGSINDLFVFISENSQIGLPNGFEIITKGNTSSFVGATASDPMILDANINFPIAKYKFDVSYQKFQNSSSPVFGLTDGTINLNLQYTKTDSILVNNSSLSGHFEFTNADASIKGICNLYGINGTETRGLPQSLSGKIKLAIAPGLSYDIHTPFIKGPGNDERAFPLNIIVAGRDSTISSEGDVSLNGGIIDFANLGFKMNLDVVVPAGKGEHEDNDNVNSADGTHPGDDQLKTGQEVFTDVEKVCRVHVYLLPYTYTFHSDFSFSSDHHNNISININHLSCDQQFVEKVNFGKDGCDAGFIGAVFGAIVGSVTGIGAGMGAIIGDIAGNDLESSIKSKLLGEVANKIDSQKGTYKLISF
jgi:hypothetical protein